MRTVKALAVGLAVSSSAGCFEGANTPNTYVGPIPGGSVSLYTLSLQPGSIVNCQLADSTMNRPVRLTVVNEKAELLTDGGVRYGLTRVAPDVYAGGYFVKMVADLRGSPKRLTFSTDDERCKWMGESA